MVRRRIEGVNQARSTRDLDPRSHWQDVYAKHEPDEVSWYQLAPEPSLAWIERAGLSPDAAILDAGGGTSVLAGELVRRGYTDVTVADISATAIERSRAQLGDLAERISWVEADLRYADLGRRYDLWHDRAVLHFMVDGEDRDNYLSVLRAAIRPGGHLIVATFGPDGPTSCSNLPVRRYDAEELSALLAGQFELLHSELLDHETPSGSTQQFLFAHLVRDAT
jgi:SAM-dependent methyltransferase